MCNGWLAYDKEHLLQSNNTKLVAAFQKSTIALAGEIPDLMMVALKNCSPLY